MIDKEVRALLPAWAACALAILASRWQVDPFKYLGVPAYFIGTAGLGAWVMGHEYTYGTLPSILTLPVPRRRIWTAKLAVVAPMLAALMVMGIFLVKTDRGDQEFGAALFLLPPLVSLFVAPWLTMLTRSPLAGAVFTFAALGGSLALGEWIGELRYGFTNQVDVFRIAFLWWAMGGLSVLGAVMGWRTFATLEAPDGHGADLELPGILRRSAAATVTRHHPLLALIGKELRLQQLPIVIAAMWALAYTIAWASGVRRFNTLDVASSMVSLTTAFYSLVLPAVIGSLACAEERHFGTLHAQLLLPVRSSTQWIVKSATALGLSLTLALLLPLALARLFGGAAVNPMAGPANRLTAESVVVILGVTAISLYVSTLARSGLHALMGSIATVFASGFMGAKALDSEWGRKVFLMVHAARHAHIHQRFAMVQHIYYVGPLAGCALLTLMLVLALPHYRYAAGRPALVAMHGAIVLVCLLAYGVAMNAIAALRF